MSHGGRKIEATVEARLFDRVIRRAHRTERARAGIQRGVVSAWRTGIRKVVDRIAGRLASRVRGRGPVLEVMRSKGYRQLVKDVNRWVERVYEGVLDDVSASIHRLAVEETRFTVQVLGQNIGVDLSDLAPSVEEIRRSVLLEPMDGRTVKQWIRSARRRTVEEVVADVNRGLEAGEPAEAIRRRIVSRGGAIGRAERDLDALTDLVSGKAADRGRREADKAAGPIVALEVWTAVLDSATCVRCAGLDGRRFETDKGPRPPIHPFCRCVRVPVAAGDKPPARETYPQWLRRQPREVQDEVLGPTRARLWRGGKIRIERMVDPRLRPLTLEELAERENLNENAIRIERRKR